MTLNLRTMLTAIGLAGVFVLPAAAAPVTIADGFIDAGVSDSGSLGSNGGTSPGILYDVTGTGNYGNNDFLTPGSPFEGSCLSSHRLL